MRETPWTIEESSALPEAEKLAMLMKAKPGTWYDGWTPYCGQEQVRCSMPRMKLEPYGFRCPECGNMIAWDLSRIAESPLNKRSEGGDTKRYRIPPLISVTIADCDPDIRLRMDSLLADAGVKVLPIIPWERDHSAQINDMVLLPGEGACRLFAAQHLEPQEKVRIIDDFAKRSYMKPTPEPRVATRREEDAPAKAAEFQAPTEMDPHSRMRYPCPGDDGRPKRHRKNRKMRKRSRQRNRRG